MNKKIKQKYRKILRGRIDKKNRSLLKNRDINYNLCELCWGSYLP